MRTIPLKKAAICLPGVLLIMTALATKPAKVSDFPEFYRAANLVHSAAGLYSDSGGHTTDTYLPFLRVPSYAYMLRPLHLLGYRSAYDVWTTSLILAFALFLWLARNEPSEIALAICYSFPVAFSIVLGQDIAFVILIAMAAVRLHSANREVAAGAVASLLIIKVTYLFPAALVFLVKSRRGSWGLAAGTGIQLALSFALEGWRWPLNVIALARSPLLDTELRRMLGVRALGAAFPYGGFFAAGAAAILVGWLWFLVRRVCFADAMRAALPLGLIAFPHSYVYDAVVFVPLFASAASLRTWTGRLALFALSPIPYLLLLGDTPARVFIGSASLITAVVFTTIGLYRARAPYAEEWSVRLTPDSAPRMSPAT